MVVITRTQFARLTALLLSSLLPLSVCAEEASPAPDFSRDVAPFLQNYCAECHSSFEPEGGLELTKYTDSGNVQTDFEIWEKVLRMVAGRQMPPEDAEQPQAIELTAAIKGIEAELAKYDCGTDRHAGRVTLRRLNRVEYNNTIRDLVGIDFQPAADFPSDEVGNGFDNIAEVLTIPPLLMEKYLEAAQTIVDRAMDDEAARERIITHTAKQTGSQAKAERRNLRDFAERAFRRPVDNQELDRLHELMQLAREQGADDREAFKLALTAVLASPHFLFRVEDDPTADDDDQTRPLNDYELASRLSYFLWSSMPDDELFRLARHEELHEPDVLAAQAQRMLKAPKAKALTKNFAGQWLQLRSLEDISPDPETFPEFDEDLRAAMRRETEMFFESIVQEDRSILDFLNADYTFVNDQLARHYDLPKVEGDDFRRVKLDSRRRGVLTQASVLLITSNPTRTSPVKRGKWVLDNILGEPPPDPPPGISSLEENAELLGSLRERLEQHRADSACAVCHVKMDALGFGLENFDVTGAWREREGNYEINAAGSLPGGYEFDNASELMQILAEHNRDSFSRCLAEKMLTYALGRGLEPYDRCTVNEIVAQLKENDYRFSQLITSIVLSDPFRFRQSKEEN